MHDELYELLAALDGVRQNPRFHPEGDALFHSLQAFELARRATSDPALWAAALLHDVGKAVSSPDHDEIGADLLDGLVSPRIVWLVRHHLDLLNAPASTKRRLRGTEALRDLQRLRAWDVGGRRPDARVPTVDEALAALLETDLARLSAEQGEAAPALEDEEARS
jgi:predicted HD phosphohydrolase